MPHKCPEKRREASRKSTKKYREKNKEKLNLVAVGRYHKLYKNPPEEVKERRKEYLKKWRAENQEKIKTYRATNEEQKEKSRIRAKEWQKANVGRTRARNTLRKKRVKQATPDWVSRKDLGEVYEQAYRLELQTGLKHHVDHIIPLVHDSVCGLHVPWNIQPIPALDNLKKGNKLL